MSISSRILQLGRKRHSLQCHYTMWKHTKKKSVSLDKKKVKRFLYNLRLSQNRNIDNMCARIWIGRTTYYTIINKGEVSKTILEKMRKYGKELDSMIKEE